MDEYVGESFPFNPYLIPGESVLLPVAGSAPERNLDVSGNP